MKKRFLSAALFLSTLFNPAHGDSVDKLKVIHSKLKLIHGSFQEEYPEQLMSVMFIPKDAIVLELGANVGRNSCVIASLLKNSNQLVALESSKEYAKLLLQNRNINKLKFHIEVSALSRVPLIQKGWDTIPSDEVLPGWIRVNSLTFDELQSKYDRVFDTLVVDAEGALYYILKDDPDMLNNIKLIITENDYTNVDHLRFVQEQFMNHGFELVYNRAGGWQPCYNEFFQVWKKKA